MSSSRFADLQPVERHSLIDALDIIEDDVRTLRLLIAKSAEKQDESKSPATRLTSSRPSDLSPPANTPSNTSAVKSSKPAAFAPSEDTPSKTRQGTSDSRRESKFSTPWDAAPSSATRGVPGTPSRDVASSGSASRGVRASRGVTQGTPSRDVALGTPSRGATPGSASPDQELETLQTVSQQYDVPVSVLRQLNPQLHLYGEDEPLPARTAVYLREKLPYDSQTSGTDADIKDLRFHRRTSKRSSKKERGEPLPNYDDYETSETDAPEQDVYYSRRHTSKRRKNERSTAAAGGGGESSNVNTKTTHDGNNAAPPKNPSYDTIRSVAIRFGVSTNDLYSHNDLSDYDLDDPLPPGVNLSIPQRRWVESTVSMPGDSLRRIATDFGVPVGALAGLNDHLRMVEHDDDIIPAGETVYLPHQKLAVVP